MKYLRSIKKLALLLIRGLKTEALALLIKIPVEPFSAIASKIAGGFKSIQYLNLSKAKKAYPDEF